MIRVLVVDDHAIVRQGLERLLATADDLELVGMAADGAEAVELAATRRPDVVLMDLSMAGVDGVEATRQIVAVDDDVRVVVLTSFGEEQRIADALDAGAHGYLLKHIDPDDLLAAIRAAARRRRPARPARRPGAARATATRGARRRAHATRGGGAAARRPGPRQQADRPAARASASAR